MMLSDGVPYILYLIPPTMGDKPHSKSSVSTDLYSGDVIILRLL